MRLVPCVTALDKRSEFVEELGQLPISPQIGKVAPSTNFGGNPVYQDLTKTVASKAKLPTSAIVVESRFFIESFYESILDKNRRNPSVDNTTSEGRRLAGG